MNMAYTEYNYKTKKELKADVAAGKQVRVYQPGPFGPDVPDGTVALEGPHYPKPHRWYASAVIKDRIIVKITG
jgi:hypothetical protein